MVGQAAKRDRTSPEWDSSSLCSLIHNGFRKAGFIHSAAAFADDCKNDWRKGEKILQEAYKAFRSSSDSLPKPLDITQLKGESEKKLIDEEIPKLNNNVSESSSSDSESSSQGQETKASNQASSSSSEAEKPAERVPKKIKEANSSRPGRTAVHNGKVGELNSSKDTKSSSSSSSSSSYSSSSSEGSSDPTSKVNSKGAESSGEDENESDTSSSSSISSDELSADAQKPESLETKQKNSIDSSSPLATSGDDSSSVGSSSENNDSSESNSSESYEKRASRRQSGVIQDLSRKLENVSPAAPANSKQKIGDSLKSSKRESTAVVEKKHKTSDEETKASLLASSGMKEKKCEVKLGISKVDTPMNSVNGAENNWGSNSGSQQRKRRRSGGDGNGERENRAPFKRVRVEEVNFKDDRLRDNSFYSKRDTYGSMAHRDLAVTKGKGFRKEKTKKKRLNHHGGKLSFEVNSYKFSDDSD
ncbi:unnamed protein product [Agarophyton chilense]